MESYKHSRKMSKGDVSISTLGDNAQVKPKLCQNIPGKLGINISRPIFPLTCIKYASPLVRTFI